MNQNLKLLVDNIELTINQLIGYIEKLENDLELEKNKSTSQIACTVCGDTKLVRITSRGKRVCGRGHVY